MLNSTGSLASPAAPCSADVASGLSPKIYIYLKGQSGQTLFGYFEKTKLSGLVEHFIDCEYD